MSYQVLARKWRPGRFSELVGQEHVVSAIANALDNDRLHHAYLFTGTRGVGKTTIARIFSKSLNCEEGMGSTPCGQCDTCREIEQGHYVDLLEIDAASRTKVEDTRELLDNVQYKPTRGRFKVYLIDEVHMLSKHSFNALLKTLEEPPPHVKFLLATTDPQKLPVTILSRCLQFNLKALSREQINQQLAHVLEQESIPFEAPALALLARSAQGSMRDALSLTDQAIAQGDNKVIQNIVIDMLGLMDKHQILKLLNQVVQQSPREVLQIVEEMAQQSPDYSQLLAELSSLLHQIALTQWVPDACKLETTSAKAIYQLSRQISPEQVQLFYQIALEGRKDLPHAVDGKSAVEMTLLRMMSFAPAPTVDDPESIISQSDSSERQINQASVDTGATSTDAIQSEKQPEVNQTTANNTLAADEPPTLVDETHHALNNESENSVLDSEYDTALAQQMDDIEAEAQQFKGELFVNSGDASTTRDESLVNGDSVSAVHEAPDTSTEQLEQSPGHLSSTQDMLALRQRIKRQRKEDDAQSKKSEPSQAFVPPRREPSDDSALPSQSPKEAKQAVVTAADESAATPPWSQDEQTSEGTLSNSTPHPATPSATPGDESVQPDRSSPEADTSDHLVAPTEPVLYQGPLQPYLPDDTKLIDANQVDEWSHLISRMNVAGLIKQIALHSDFTKKDGVVTLELDSSQAHLINDNAVAQVQQALSTALGQEIRLDMKLGEPAQTPFSLQQQINDMRQQYAHTLVSNDAFFTTLTDAFSARVNTDSVKAR